MQNEEKRVCPVKGSQNRSSAFSVIFPQIKPSWPDQEMTSCRGKPRVAHASTILFCAENRMNPQQLNSQPVKGKLGYLPNTWAMPIPKREPGPGSVCRHWNQWYVVLIFWHRPCHRSGSAPQGLSQIICGAGRDRHRLSPLPVGSLHVVSLLWRFRTKW